MSQSPNGITVLVVEDTGPLCKMIGRMLRESGYTVLEAADGAEALALVDQQADGIQLVLTDVIMPRMKGTELADRLSRLRPELPVLFMSGFADDPVVQGVAKGGDRFLRKPFTAKVLIEAVNHAVTRPVNNGRGTRPGEA
jgi:two-component system, cell cycle sensor histidine kinase and response regulator CckA